jgi:hypothetical protein
VQPRSAFKAQAKEALVTEPVSVVKALEKDLKEIRRRAPDLADSILVATLYEMARQLDSPKNSATSKSMCAKALLDGLDRLHAQLPVAEEQDAVDDLAARRARRLAGGAGAEG